MKNKFKNDNRGLTLLELIVGVVILAIVVVPLLHTFVTGANTARKSKQYSDATLAAQNIIEEIQATDMEEYLEGLEPIDNAVDPNKGKYVIPYFTSSGGTKFDARIIIDTGDPLNSEDEPIPFSNQMDAVFTMQDADTIAQDLFKSSADKDFSVLERYITIDVDNVSSGCKVSVTFEYEGRAKKTYLDNAGNEYSENIFFKYPIVNEMNVSPHSDGTFAVYLFFKAYKFGNADIKFKNTVINNNTRYDFNVFLVDVGDEVKNISHEVHYKPTERGTIAGLFTNMASTTYKLYKHSGSIWQTSEELGVGLVQTGAINRLYDISVEIYKNDEEQDYSDKLLSMETSKLDYSIQ